MPSDAFPVPPVNETGIYHTEYAGGPPAVQPDRAGAATSSGGSASPSSGFAVDTAGMRSQASALAECGNRAAQVLDRLRSALESGGMPWGTDDLGKAFGHKYTGPANQGFASIAGLPAGLVNVANELIGQAGTYDAVEQHITESIRKIGGSGSGSSADA